MIDFILNGATVRGAGPAGLPLLDFIRYQRHLPGTKIGCREGDCGACTVLVGELQGDGVRYRAITSCLMPLANVRGKHVVTVEGINPPADGLTPVQQALVDASATQCGFCTVGFVMALTAHCLENDAAEEQRAAPSATAGTSAAPPPWEGVGGRLAAIDGNICRCTGYKSIERAADRLTEFLAGRNGQPTLAFAIDRGIVPAYFGEIPARLAELNANHSIAQSLHHSIPNHSITPSPNHSIILGGGTDLYVQRPEAMVHGAAELLVDRGIPREIREAGGRVEIGAAATVTELLESPLLHAIFPRLTEQLRRVASTPIRNMATVGGNLVNASPIGDLTVWLLALDASVVLRNGAARELPLREFYLGYKKLDKTAGEVLETVRFRRPAGRYIFNFEKVCKRTFLDIASVNSACFLRVENETVAEAHVAVGGVAPVPLYLPKTSAFLRGKPFDPELLADEAEALLQTEISPISDVRGSAEYKRRLAGRLLRAHFLID